MIMQLVISWICIVVFAVVAVITILGMVKIIPIAKRYLDKLFTILIVEVVVTCVGVFSGFVKSPKTVEMQLKQDGRQEIAQEWLPKLKANQQAIQRLANPSVTISSLERQNIAASFNRLSAALDSVATRKTR